MKDNTLPEKAPLAWKAHVRIIWAITAKDLVEAVTNRMTLSILLGIVIMVISGFALPLLTRLNAKPTALVFDPGHSPTIQALTRKEAFWLRLVDSQEAMENATGNASTPVLGLVIPEDFEQPPETLTGREIPGFFPHWANEGDITALATFFQDELEQAIGYPVRIDIAEHPAYPSPHDSGQQIMLTLSMVIMPLTLGLALVPHLLVDEKEKHTLDALLVSPAAMWQIIAGKALTGIFYCLTGGAIILLAINNHIVHWDIALTAIVLSTLFSVALGLLIGAIVETPSNITSWLGLLMVLLLIPVSVLNFNTDHWPGWIVAVLSRLPTVAVVRLVQISMAGDLAGGSVFPHLLTLGIAVLLSFILLVWAFRRSIRRS
ncbi:MAG: ABC transporter permease [Anaerolineae bacterium]|nr:ABC transporter permease [Anaerolineae bacterium]